MDNNTVNTSGPAKFSSPSSPEMSKPVGPVIGLIVILLIILVGGIYFWMSRADQAPIQNNTVTQEGPTPEQIVVQGSSDEISDIEADLNAFDSADIGGSSSF